MEPSQEGTKELFELCALGRKDAFNTSRLRSLLQEIGPNVQNEYGDTPLRVVLKKHPKNFNYNLFETILQCGGDGMVPIERERFLADVIFTFASKRAISIYLPYHKDVNAVLNRSKKTALHILVERQKVSSVLEILKRGADPNLRDVEGKTPLHRAIVTGCEIMTKYLLRHGADVNAQCEEGSTPLHYAFVSTRDTGCSSLLLQYNCDVNLKDKNGYSPLYYLVKYPNYYGDGSILQSLLNAGCRIKDSADDFKPLHILARDPNFSFNAVRYAKILIRSGVNVNERDSSNSTPLHIAARLGFWKFVTCLLHFGARVDVLNDDNEHPLQIITESRVETHPEEVIDILRLIALKEFSKEFNSEGIIFQRYAETYQSMKRELVELADFVKFENKVGYIDFLLADESLLRKYVLKEGFEEYMKELEDYWFEHYYFQIEKRFREVQRRTELEEFGVDFLSSIFEGKLPLLVVERLVKFCTNMDLTRWKNTQLKIAAIAEWKARCAKKGVINE